MLRPHDPRIPGRPVTFFSFFFCRCSQASRGHVVLVEERQDGVHTTVQINGHTFTDRKCIVPEMYSLWVKTTQNLCVFAKKKVPHPPFFPLLFPIAVKSFPETLFCNQSAHSDSYNYPTSSVQLTAPKQSSSEMGTCFYFDNAC